MSERWVVLSPAGVRAAARVETAEPLRPRAAGRIRIGFLSNRKPNTVAWQRWVAGELERSQAGFEFAYYEKSNPAVGAAPELLDRITEECALVITGTGD